MFFINIYIANHYMADIFGEYQFYMTLFMFLLAFSQMGTMQSFTVFAPKVKNSIKLIFATLILRIIGYTVVALLLLLLFFILNLPNIAFVFLLLYIPLTINLASILDYYQKIEIDVKYNFMFDASLFSALTFLVIENNMSILYIVFARFISKSFAEYMKYRYISSDIGNLKFSKKYLVWMYIKSRIFIFNRIIVELYAKSEVLLLGLLATHKDVGLYTVAFTIYSAILMGEGLLARKLFPKLTKAFHNDIEAKKILNLSILYKSAYFLTAILITYFILNKLIFTYLYNPDEYARSGNVLNFMLVGLVSHIFANNTNYLLMLKDKYLYIKRFSIGLVLNIFLGYIFFYFYDLEGYTLAIQMVKIIMVMYSVYISYNYLNKRLNKDTINGN